MSIQNEYDLTIAPLHGELESARTASGLNTASFSWIEIFSVKSMFSNEHVRNIILGDETRHARFPTPSLPINIPAPSASIYADYSG